ncbi:MAG: response regulator, partial [Candidatus Thermoplasmatota archaeon]
MQKKVLIVEDEVLTSDLIRRYLIERGHLVTDQCLSYEEAVTSFHNEKPDVALIDIRLYGQKSGIDLASYLSSQPNCPTLIFLTAQYDQLTVEKALGTQPDGYLTKPIQKESLWTTIETAQRIQGHQLDDKSVHQHIISDGKHHHTVLE